MVDVLFGDGIVRRTPLAFISTDAKTVRLRAYPSAAIAAWRVRPAGGWNQAGRLIARKEAT